MSRCDDILEKAKSLHLDECEVASIEKKITTVRITDSEIAEIKQNFDRSIGIRIIHQKKILSANFVDITPDKISELVSNGRYLRPKSFWRTLPRPAKITKIENCYDKTLDEISGIGAIDIANTMINAADNDRITRISGSLNIVSEFFQISNSNELSHSDKATYISGTLNVDSDSGIVPVSGVGYSSSRTLKSFSADDIGKDASEMCINSINPEKCESDTYSIIFEPYAFGELLAFVFASNFNLKTYSDKRSCFSDKIGKQIATERFSLIDDPHISEGIGSKPFDDEGTPTYEKYLIESGIFAHVFSDSFHAFKGGYESTGNAARAGSPMGRSTQPIPTPQPHNLRVVAGNRMQNEIIQDTKKGLLVGRLWYTYPVNPERGDFSCTARSGIRLIENGKITSPAKTVRIVHNLQLLLKNVSAIGNDSRNVLQWNALPCITPSVRVESIKIIPI